MRTSIVSARAVPASATRATRATRTTRLMVGLGLGHRHPELGLGSGCGRDASNVVLLTFQIVAKIVACALFGFPGKSTQHFWKSWKREEAMHVTQAGDGRTSRRDAHWRRPRAGGCRGADPEEWNLVRGTASVSHDRFIDAGPAGEVGNAPIGSVERVAKRRREGGKGRRRAWRSGASGATRTSSSA